MLLLSLSTESETWRSDGGTGRSVGKTVRGCYNWSLHSPGNCIVTDTPVHVIIRSFKKLPTVNTSVDVRLVGLDCIESD